MRKIFIILIGLFCVTTHAQEVSVPNTTLATISGLTYASPSEVNLDAAYIHSKVDSIITNGIKNEAFPGAQILVAKNSKIIFHKAYGFHTYDSVQRVALDDIYDLASVTKITAALPALMKLHGEGKLDLDKPFSRYWKPWGKKKNKKHLTVREVLAHQAGLTPYIVFLNEITKKNGKLKKRWVRDRRTSKYNHQVFENLYIKTRFTKKVYRKISNSKVAEEKKYKYSGLTFLLYPQLVENLTGMQFSKYLRIHFYDPLGNSTMDFNPKKRNFPNAIVPTELDTLFRHTLTRNWVHDENAALMGGISGNAGLFATAEDLARLMQMYMQYGTYNGKRYLSEATVKEFIKVQYPSNENRRGLGFDKALLNNSDLELEDAYPAPEVSAESFGHSGFTGTFVWADPKNKMVYIFLSNRVNPTRDHRDLYKLKIREAVQQVFYAAGLPLERSPSGSD